MRTRFLPGSAVVVAFSLSACSDAITNPGNGFGREIADLSRYVAIGTSVSMGWQSDGVVASAQETAWTKQLASLAGVEFRQPLIAAPGCQPPLAAPLASFRRVDGSSVAVPSTVCAENLPGVVLPTNDLAVENATAHEALTGTPETASKGRGPVTSRVLPPGMTQVTAMRSMAPTFVSVEFGGNEVLPAQVGLLVPGVTYTALEAFTASYDEVIANVRATGAQAILVALPSDLREFPTIRTGPEIAAERIVFAAFHVTVNADCDESPNFIFVRGKVLTAIATGAGRRQAGLGPYDLSCADVPGKVDYVLTPADVDFLNALVADMNRAIAMHALQNRYALTTMDAAYATSKQGVRFDLQAYLMTPTPYGPVVSLDGVHLNAAGHRKLAVAAAEAINFRYGNKIPLSLD